MATIRLIFSLFLFTTIIPLNGMQRLMRGLLSQMPQVRLMRPAAPSLIAKRTIISQMYPNVPTYPVRSKLSFKDLEAASQRLSGCKQHYPTVESVEHTPDNPAPLYFAKIETAEQTHHFAFETTEEALQIANAARYNSSIKFRHSTEVLFFEEGLPRIATALHKSISTEPHKQKLRDVSLVEWFKYSK